MNCTLLIVDDNKSVRDSLRFIFERRGYRVLAAEDGYRALAIARESEIDAAMIDVNMPGMNGVEVCRELKTMSSLTGRRMLLWMMTGAKTQELARSAGEAGALEVFAKPFNFPELFRRLEEALGPVEPPKPAPDVLDHL